MTNIYYQLLSLLYEKIEGKGFLDLKDADVPMRADAIQIYLEVTECVWNGTSKTECFRLVDKLVQKDNLNKDFCDKIRSSPSLRFLLCENLHDARINEIMVDGSDLKFLINCGSCMGKPIMNGFMQTKISVKFFGVKNFVFLEERNHLKDFDYVTHEISYDENGGFIICKIRLLKQKGNDLAYRDMVIHCDDIVVEGLSHEM